MFQQNKWDDSLTGEQVGFVVDFIEHQSYVLNEGILSLFTENVKTFAYFQGMGYYHKMWGALKKNSRSC